MTGTDTTVIIGLVVLAAIGASLYFVGFLVALATALGNRRWWWAIGMVLCLPLAIVYCLCNRALAAWPLKLLTAGFAALLLAAALSALFLPQLYSRPPPGMPAPAPAVITPDPGVEAPPIAH